MDDLKRQQHGIFQITVKHASLSNRQEYELLQLESYNRSFQAWYLWSIMRCRTRKPTICICENKDADQLCSTCTADHRHCFRNLESTIPLSVTPLPCFCDRTERFVSDLVENQDRLFSHTKAHISECCL